MKKAIFTDVHADLQRFEAVLRGIDRYGGVEERYHLGDIVGYSSQPNECIELMRTENIPSVMGNHDAAVAGIQDTEFFRERAVKMIEWTKTVITEDNLQYLRELRDEMKIGPICIGVHGSVFSRDEYVDDWKDAVSQADYLEGRANVKICFHGHTHRAAIFSERGNNHVTEVPYGKRLVLMSNGPYYVNPGSVSKNRDGDRRPAFAVLDTDDWSMDFQRVEL